ncbi:hypothetical protein M3795_25005 [Ralstonia pickettii]|uniref:hypothetical protein n=1 Tax=Ralstonia pickettii TaxID=329 RepID=UPI0020410AD0|nr:hypothetical protein [Ralstonia pickettii]MCM3583732.1 hypothetical protein [Ralstonia pickettii]
MLSMATGERYKIRTKEWTAGNGEVVPARDIERVVVGPHAVDGIEFVEVCRDNGSKHLIAIETIQSATPV